MKTRSHVAESSAGGAATAVHEPPSSPASPGEVGGSWVGRGGASEAHLAASSNEAWQRLAGFGWQLKRGSKAHSPRPTLCLLLKDYFLGRGQGVFLRFLAVRQQKQDSMRLYERTGSSWWDSCKMVMMKQWTLRHVQVFTFCCCCSAAMWKLRGKHRQLHHL